MVVVTTYNRPATSEIVLRMDGAPGQSYYIGLVQVMETDGDGVEVTSRFNNRTYDKKSADVKAWLQGDLERCSGEGS